LTQAGGRPLALGKNRVLHALRFLKRADFDVDRGYFSGEGSLASNTAGDCLLSVASRRARRAASWFPVS